MYRTAQNLLNLKEPILSESKPLQLFHRNSLTDLKLPAHQTYGGSTTLQRKLKTRESHNSYQSNSTSDGSVHSHSSSMRTETDEENNQIDVGRTNGLPILNGGGGSSSSSSSSSTTSTSSCGNNNNINRRASITNQQANEMEAMALGKDRVKSVASSSADDESGFSSMNSFHHEPNTMAMLPPLALNSTMLSNQLSLDVDVGGGCGKRDNHHIIPKPEQQFDGNAFNLLQTDIKSALPPVIHERFDAAPPIPPKAPGIKKLTTFNSLRNENADKAAGIQVLWV